MIIFYDKTGNIVGTIDGRIHDEAQLKMWIGEGTERIVCQWEQNESGEYEPSTQKEVFTQLDSGERKPQDFKVNIETKELELL